MANSVKLCMVGAGRVGKNHSNAIVRHVAGGEIVALVDPAEEVRLETAAEFGIQCGFPTLAEAIDKVAFDGVIITTPTPTHVDLAREAAANGKNIFLEKPMALNLEECDQIIRAAENNHVILQLGFMRRFQPEFVTAYERIQSGQIGNPMMVKSLTHGPGLPPMWACDLRTSNGMLAEVNSHDWDAVRWLMGSDYKRVYVETANLKGDLFNIDIPDFYDNALVNIKFENDTLGMFSGICPCGYGYDARMEIVGDKGIMQIGEMQGEAIVLCNDRDTGLITPIFQRWPQRFLWGYIYELEHFINCIKSGTQPKVGGDEGRWAVAGVLAGTKSFKEERPVYLKEVMG